MAVDMKLGYDPDIVPMTEPELDLVRIICSMKQTTVSGNDWKCTCRAVLQLLDIANKVGGSNGV